MKNVLVTLALHLFLASHSYAQAPAIEWQASLGGTDWDEPISMQITPDGGCIATGLTLSNNGDVSGNHGFLDYWVVKLNATGLLEWQKSLGGAGREVAHFVQNTPDGGYILLGNSDLKSGDVEYIHGGYDCWLVKLTATGTIEWQKSLGGTLHEAISEDAQGSIENTADGGYILAISSNSNDGDVSGNHGGYDYWIVKLSSTGAIEWQKSLGGTGDDYAGVIRLTPDGGYIVAGTSNSNNGNVSGNHGSFDYWIVKLSSTGAIEWQKSLGGSSKDQANDLKTTADGGYIVAGFSKSNNGNITGNHGGYDYWVVKLNATGAIEWQKSLGGTSDDYLYSIEPTIAGGGYVLAGHTFSKNGDVSSNNGLLDYWVVKLTATGAIEWEKSLGGTRYEFGRAIGIASDGGYIVAGKSSSKDGDVIENHGDDDFWIVKLAAAPVTTHDTPAALPLLTTYPNPTTGPLSISMQDGNKMQGYSIYDQTGKMIIDIHLENAVQTAEVNLADTPSGVYLLQVYAGDQVHTQKVVVQ